MELGKAGWLSALLEEAVAAHARSPGLLVEPALPPGASGRARARAYLRRVLRASGLVYGNPAETAAAAAHPGHTPEQQLFLAVLRTFNRMALDVARLVGAPPVARGEHLWLLWAVFTGRLEEAAVLERWLALMPGEAPPGGPRARVERALERRALSLVGDPVYGLVLHNGALYADAQLFGRQAIELFSRRQLRPQAARRHLAHAVRTKAQLVQVLTQLAAVERVPSFASRRAILRQVAQLGLPPGEERALQAQVRRAFLRRQAPEAVVRGVRTLDQRHFLLEQTLLAALVGGQRSREERAFIERLARALEVPPEVVRRLELQMAEFYAANRRVVDVFTVSPAVGVLGDEVVAGMQEALESNYQRLMREVRQTGELSRLLGRAARGHTLSAEEKRRMRTQLVEVAKAIPALALFAAPGGALLLVALARVLPANLLPAAFQDEEP